MRLLLYPVVAALAALPLAPLPGQLATTVDAGAVRVRYSGADASSVMTVTPAVTYEHARGVVMTAATLSRFEGGGDALQAVLAGSVFAGSWRRLHFSAGGAAEGSTFGYGTTTSSLLADARLHWVGEGQGAWIAGLGGAANDAMSTHRIRRGEVGGWLQRSGVTISAWVSPADVQGGLRYTDAESALRWVRGPVELLLSAGARTSDSLGSSTWGGATAAYWLTPHLALVGSGGSYAPDPAQSLPGGDYVALSLRVASRPTVRRVEARRPQPAAPPVVARPIASGFEIAPARNGNRTIVIVAPSARTVELMGDFTDWETVQLQPAGADRWRISVPVTSGTYRFNIRVDGGDWGVPPGVTALHDEFSGVVAVLHLQ